MPLRPRSTSTSGPFLKKEKEKTRLHLPQTILKSHRGPARVAAVWNKCWFRCMQPYRANLEARSLEFKLANDFLKRLSWIQFLSFSVADLSFPSFLFTYFCLFLLLAYHPLALSLSLFLISLFDSFSPPSPSALSIPFHLSLLLLSCFPSAHLESWTNKQAAGGLCFLSIIQASQTTVRMFAKHKKYISPRHRKEKKGEICFMAWLQPST